MSATRITFIEATISNKAIKKIKRIIADDIIEHSKIGERRKRKQ